MNPEFESNVKEIKYILQKRVLYLYIICFCFGIFTLIFIAFFSENTVYNTILIVMLFLLFIIPNMLRLTIKKLEKYLVSYEKNKQDVIDYLKIVLKNAEYTKHNFIMRHFYKPILPYYKLALEAIIKDDEL